MKQLSIDELIMIEGIFDKSAPEKRRKELKQIDEETEELKKQLNEESKKIMVVLDECIQDTLQKMFKQNQNL